MKCSAQVLLRLAGLGFLLTATGCSQPGTDRPASEARPVLLEAPAREARPALAAPPDSAARLPPGADWRGRHDRCGGHRRRGRWAHRLGRWHGLGRSGCGRNRDRRRGRDPHRRHRSRSRRLLLGGDPQREHGAVGNQLSVRPAGGWLSVERDLGHDRLHQQQDDGGKGRHRAAVHDQHQRARRRPARAATPAARPA